MKLLGHRPFLKICAAIASATLLIAGCARDSSTVTTSTVTVTKPSSTASPATSAANTETARDFTVGAFTAVQLAGPYELDLNMGSPQSVRAQGDSAALDLLDIRTEGNTLGAGVKPNVQWPADVHVTVTVTAPTITAAGQSGTGRMRIGSVHTDALSISQSGSGAIEAPELFVTKITVSASGTGQIRAGGTADDADIQLSGSGQADLAALAVKRANVTVAGTGHLNIQASERVSGLLAGTGSVRVTGGATCSVSNVGLGTITCG